MASSKKTSKKSKSKDEDKKKAKKSSSKSSPKKSAKKTTSKKPAKRKAKEVEAVKAVKKAYTHSQIIEKLAEKVEGIHKHMEDQEALSKKIVKSVLENYANLVMGSIAPGGIGEIKILGGLMKVKTVKVKAKKMDAIKKGTMVMNPFLGKEVPHAGRKAFTKPAFIKLKVLPMKKLKDQAND